MNTILFLLLLMFCSFSFTQEKTVAYDSILAKKLGADEYGMKTYYFVYLKAGKNRSQDSLEVEHIQRAHLDNIAKLANEGKLIVAGPFMDDNEVRGIFILNAKSMEEAMEWTQTDPAVKAGRLIMEVHPFYCSAALMMVPELHKKIAKVQI
ncbi:MAG: YciI family protein [Flavobacteriia bacterium]